MKNSVAVVGLCITVSIVLFFGAVQPAAAQNPEKYKEVRAQYQKGIALMKQRKFVEALPFMEQAAALALKAMPAPRVLHLATHGFFLDREPDTKEPMEDGAGAGWARKRLKTMENPLLRSGIVLAGANTVGDKEATVRVEDGWVTAEEIAMLNLQGTELVVLSACQTGLGDIKTGEGVHGLRRAFLYAGAQTLVTSLFEVPDTETRALMNRFYTNFKTGQGKLRSLYSAQRSFIEERRQTQGAAHPFFWASFVLVGNAD